MEMTLIPFVIWEDLSHEKRCCNYQLSSKIKTTTTWSIMVNTKSSHKVKNKNYSIETYGNTVDISCHSSSKICKSYPSGQLFSTNPVY